MPIVAIGTGNPLVDGRQSQNAMTVRTGVLRYFGTLNIAALPEVPLACGRRADLMAIDRKGAITIVEIKSSIEDFRVDRKWPEYKAYCDRFIFATHSGVPADIFPGEEGLMIADNFDAHVMREGNEHRLPPATRKAITLRFSRIAALRLERVTQYALANGIDPLQGIEPEMDEI